MLCVGVYLSLHGDIIPNNGYIVISDIGSTNDSALICHTNRPPVLYYGYHNSGGNWFGPDETVIDFRFPGFRRNRSRKIVRLLKRFYVVSVPPPEGIYQCVVEDDTFVEQTIHVGLYNRGEGTNVNS